MRRKNSVADPGRRKALQILEATRSDTFSPCVVTKWASLEDPYGNITLELPSGSYQIETFDTKSSSTAKTHLQWTGGKKHFSKPGHVAEDWVLLVVAR